MIPESLLTHETFLAHATADTRVVGLVLKGSHAHDGMATEYSDHDVYVILDEGADTDLASLDGYRSAELDLVVTTIDAFRHFGGYERYSLARARVLLDRLDGEITDIVTGKGRLSADEAFRGAADWLDAYANSLYRSIKNARDGHLLAVRLDAADSIRALLEFLFALDRRTAGLSVAHLRVCGRNA